jgi:hypothetical protein
MNITATPFSTKRIVLALVLAFVTIVGVIVYSISAVLSDDRTYSRLSLDYLILTPEIIKDLPFELPAEAEFTYSAADGPKPAISIIEYTTKGDQDHLIAAIGEYLQHQGLSEQSPGMYTGGAQEVLVHLLSHETSSVQIRIEVLDYLN